MIKEYLITIFKTDKITDATEETACYGAIDLLGVAYCREDVDNQGITVISLGSNNEMYLHIEYEDFIKDWQNARNTNIARVVPIPDKNVL